MLENQKPTLTMLSMLVNILGLRSLVLLVLGLLLGVLHFGSELATLRESSVRREAHVGLGFLLGRGKLRSEVCRKDR